MKKGLPESSPFINPTMPLADPAEHYLSAMLECKQMQAGDLVMDAAAQGETLKDIYLENTMPSRAYEEVRPCFADFIHRLHLIIMER
jgi:hypothetical protein